MLYYSVLTRTDLGTDLFDVPDTELHSSEEVSSHETNSEEIGLREYRGFWTVETSHVDEIIGYLETAHDLAATDPGTASVSAFLLAWSNP